MIDLSTEYLGLKLRNPLEDSLVPLCEQSRRFVLLQESGAAAVVLPSLFEEQIELESEDLDRWLDVGAESNAERITIFRYAGL